MRLFFAILFCVLSAPALAAGTLIVEGEGQVSRAPDHSVIEMSLNEQGRDAGAILFILRTCVDSVINALKQNGIDKNTLRPSDYMFVWITIMIRNSVRRVTISPVRRCAFVRMT